MDEMTVEVEVSALTYKLTQNRDAHRELFLEALDGYKLAMLAALETRIQQVMENKQVNQYLGLPEPEDHTADYDRVISMLSMHTKPTLVIGAGDYAQFVMDDWDWKRKWVASNSAYSAKIR